MAKFDPYEHLKIRLNHDGSLERMLAIPKKAADPQGKDVASRDITIDAQKNLWVRVYSPTNLLSGNTLDSKLPLMIYFPGGGWINQSVADVFCHAWCNQCSKEIPSIIVAVNYRQAPEHRLPAQYEDGVDTIMWVRKQATDPNGEQWLKNYADFSRCYLAGRSSGANLVYNASLRILDNDIQPLNICGMVLNQPMFGGEKRTNSEKKYACDEILPLPCWDLMWELALPKGANRDHRYSNPMVDTPQQNKLNRLGKCLVIGYGMDPLLDRQQEFVTTLVKCGAKVEAHFEDVGFHGIDLVDAKRGYCNLLLVKDFVK